MGRSISTHRAADNIDTKIKWCPRCEEEKPITSQNKRGNICGDCWRIHRQKYYRKNRKEIIARVRANQKKDPEGLRNRQLKYKYGITQDDYDFVLSSQKGLCAICKQPETRKFRGRITPLAVDHNHKTKEVRGLLCHRCNRAIGLLGDDPELLTEAAMYIQRACWLIPPLEKTA